MTEETRKLSLFPYLKLIEDFLDGKIPIKEISRLYQGYFLEDQNDFGPESPAFDAINEFFLDCEDYVDDPTLRRADDFDDQELRRRAEQAKSSIATLVTQGL